MQRKQKKRRRGYTAAELAEVFDRWQRGESSDGIARALNRGWNVYSLLARYGGIRPRTRRRSARALTVTEREEISRGVASGQSLRSIARILSRAPSTLSREVRRNGCRASRLSRRRYIGFPGGSTKEAGGPRVCVRELPHGFTRFRNSREVPEWIQRLRQEGSQGLLRITQRCRRRVPTVPSIADRFALRGAGS